MFKDFLSKLGANPKVTVGVSISPGVGLEMAVVDMHTQAITQYAFQPLEYNFSSREVVDYGAFQEALSALFEELNISPKCNIILTVPTVHFGTIDLPLLLTDDAITNAIISEVEQSYIFKRQDPVVSWTEVTSNVDTENRQLVYAAIQQSAIDGFEAACSELGTNLLGIEVSCASLMKTLSFLNFTEAQMKDNVSWNLMVINQNSYAIFSMSGKKVIEYYEEPLALKSFVDDEIYNAITTSAQLTLSSLPANYLYIVSETDLVSSEILSMKIQTESTVNFLESNKYSQKEIIPVNLDIIQSTALKITPEAVGSAIYSQYPFPVRFNFLKSGEGNGEDSLPMANENYPKVNIGGIEVELTPMVVKKLLALLFVILILPIALTWLALRPYIASEQAKLDGINQKITADNAEIQKYKKSESSFNPQDEALKITKQNKLELLYFEAMGASIPNKLWVTYYDTNSSGNIDIKGKSSDVESIYIFYKNLKQLVPESNVKISSLEMESSSFDSIVSAALSGGPKYFSFEISNLPSGKPASTESKDGENGAAAGSQPQGNMPNGAPNQPQQGAGQPQGQPQQNSPQPSGGHAPSSQQNNTPPASAGSASPSGGSNGGLPPNLQKIEKF